VACVNHASHQQEEGLGQSVLAVALAAKHARIAWAILAHGTEYRPAGPEVVAA
jgi:hypothetical protein